MMLATLEDIKLLEFDRIIDARGNLSFFENKHQIPFVIKRIQYFYDIPGGESFRGYAYRDVQEIIIALSGSFDVVIHNGVERKCITLNRSYFGLYIPPMAWRHIKNFSTNSLAMVVADARYREKDFIRNFKDFASQKND